MSGQGESTTERAWRARGCTFRMPLAGQDGGRRRAWEVGAASHPIADLLVAMNPRCVESCAATVVNPADV